MSLQKLVAFRIGPAADLRERRRGIILWQPLHTCSQLSRRSQSRRKLLLMCSLLVSQDTARGTDGAGGLRRTAAGRLRNGRPLWKWLDLSLPVAALHCGGAFARRARRTCGLNGSIIWPVQGIPHVLSCGLTSGPRANYGSPERLLGFIGFRKATALPKGNMLCC